MSDDKWHGHGIFDQDCLKCRIAELEAERQDFKDTIDKLEAELATCHRIIRHGAQTGDDLAYVFDIEATPLEDK